MKKRMFLDDCRNPSIENFDIICRSYNEAIKYVKENGIPDYISFDHDLGTDETGYDFAKWLVNSDIENMYIFPDGFSFNVHSANPIGKRNIESLLNSYLKFKFR